MTVPVEAHQITSADSPLSLHVERILLFVAVVGVYALYFPLSHYTITLEPVDVTTWVDTALPLWTDWIYIYAAIFFVASLPIVVVKNRQLMRRVAAAYILVEVSALFIFVLMPVHMTLRPEHVPGEGFAVWGTNLCYWLDLPVNCFPSLHVANAFMGAMACWKADKWVGRVSYGLAWLILLSIMLVKQHFLADGVAGLLIATVSYLVFVRPMDVSGVSPRALRFPRWTSALVVAAYVVAVVALYVAYVSGWTPWVEV